MPSEPMRTGSRPGLRTIWKRKVRNDSCRDGSLRLDLHQQHRVLFMKLFMKICGVELGRLRKHHRVSVRRRSGRCPQQQVCRLLFQPRSVDALRAWKRHSSRRRSWKWLFSASLDQTGRPLYQETVLLLHVADTIMEARSRADINARSGWRAGDEPALVLPDRVHGSSTEPLKHAGYCLSSAECSDYPN